MLSTNDLCQNLAANEFLSNFAHEWIFCRILSKNECFVECCPKMNFFVKFCPKMNFLSNLVQKWFFFIQNPKFVRKNVIIIYKFGQNILNSAERFCQMTTIRMLIFDPSTTKHTVKLLWSNFMTSTSKAELYNLLDTCFSCLARECDTTKITKKK